MFLQHSFVSIFQPHHQQQEQQAFAPSVNSIPQYGMPVRFNPMIGFALAGLFAICFFMGSLCVYLKRFCVHRGRRDRARLPVLVLSSVYHTSEGLDKDAILSIPLVEFSPECCSKQGKSQTECSVCLTEFQQGEALKFLPGCSHLFHPDCIDMWLHSHSTCPVCRCFLLPGKCRFEESEAAQVSVQPGEVAIVISDIETSGDQLHEDDSTSSHEKDDDSFSAISFMMPMAVRTYLHRSNSSPMMVSAGPESEGEKIQSCSDDTSVDHVEALSRLRRAVSSVGI